MSFELDGEQFIAMACGGLPAQLPARRCHIDSWPREGLGGTMKGIVAFVTLAMILPRSRTRSDSRWTPTRCRSAPPRKRRTSSLIAELTGERRAERQRVR